MMEHTKYLVLLSNVYHKQDRLEDSMLHLTKARDMQTRSVLKITTDGIKFFMHSIMQGFAIDIRKQGSF